MTDGRVLRGVKVAHNALGILSLCVFIKVNTFDPPPPEARLIKTSEEIGIEGLSATPFTN